MPRVWHRLKINSPGLIFEDLQYIQAANLIMTDPSKILFDISARNSRAHIAIRYSKLSWLVVIIKFE